MTRTIKPAPVRKTLTVAAPPERAFEVFTAGFDRWWPRSHTIGKGPLKEVVLEAGVGGRWYGIDDDGSETDWGDVLIWDPPGRLVLAWRIGTDWQHHPDLLTEVEVTFTAQGKDATRVDFEHRHLERMGEGSGGARDRFDSPNGWGGILQRYADSVRSG